MPAALITVDSGTEDGASNNFNVPDQLASSDTEHVRGGLRWATDRHAANIVRL
jgi:hypothetical protein